MALDHGLSGRALGLGRLDGWPLHPCRTDRESDRDKLQSCAADGSNLVYPLCVLEVGLQFRVSRCAESCRCQDSGIVAVLSVLEDRDAEIFTSARIK